MDFGINLDVTDYSQCMLGCESLAKDGSVEYIRDLNASITDLLVHVKKTGELERFWGTVEKENQVAIKQAARVQKDQRRLEQGDEFDSEFNKSQHSTSSEESDWSVSSSGSEGSGTEQVSQAISTTNLLRNTQPLMGATDQSGLHLLDPCSDRHVLKMNALTFQDKKVVSRRQTEQQEELELQRYTPTQTSQLDNTERDRITLMTPTTGGRRSRKVKALPFNPLRFLALQLANRLSERRYAEAEKAAKEEQIKKDKLAVEQARLEAIRIEELDTINNVSLHGSNLVSIQIDNEPSKGRKQRIPTKSSNMTTPGQTPRSPKKHSKTPTSFNQAAKKASVNIPRKPVQQKV